MPDIACLGYHGLMLLRVVLSSHPEAVRKGLPALIVLFLATALTVAMVRGEFLPPGRLRAIAYRMGIIVPIILSYVPLRHALPAIGRPLLDVELWHIDRMLFGETPALLFERFVNAHSVEWFAFFYYSYFTLAFLHVFGSAFFDRGRRPAELLFATMSICIIGQTMYTLVPGVGPYAAVPFSVPLRGGFFFGLVKETVASAGAMLDIFPSLHTAYPTLFTLHALRYRKTFPYRYTVIPIAFFAVNIIIATLFLRWHYAIDVVAGVFLAVCAHRLGILFARKDSDEKRAAEGRQPVWESLRAPLPLPHP